MPPAQRTCLAAQGIEEAEPAFCHGFPYYSSILPPERFSPELRPFRDHSLGVSLEGNPTIWRSI